MLGQTITLDDIERLDRESIGFTNLIEDRYISYSDCNNEYLSSADIMNHQLYTISNTLGLVAFINSENCIKISSTFDIHEYIQKRLESLPKTIYEHKLESTPNFIKFSENGMNLVFSVKDELIIFNFTRDLKFKQLRHKFDSEIVEFDCKLDNKIFILLSTNSIHYLNYEHNIVVKQLECITDCSTLCSNNKILNNYLLVGTNTSDLILVNFEKDSVLFKCKIDDIERVHCLNWFDNFYCTFSTFVPFNDAVDFKIVILQLNHECFIGQPSSENELVVSGETCMEFFPDFQYPVAIDNTCRYHTVYLDHWKMLLCSTSTDGRIVVFQQDEGKFKLLTLNSKWSIDTFPLYEDNQTFSLGLVADFGYDYQIDNIKSKTDAAKHEASPLIHIYLTSGFIVTYSLTNCDELKKYPVVHGSKSLSSLKIEELPQEKKEPIVEKETSPTIENKNDSPVVQNNIIEIKPPVIEEKPAEYAIPQVKTTEVTKQPVMEQPKIQFNPINPITNNNSNLGGFNFGNNNPAFTFNPVTKPSQPVQPTQANASFSTGLPPITTQPKPFNPPITQPTIPEVNTQKQPLAQPKNNAIEKITPSVTTGIVDKNMIQSLNNFSSNLTTTNTETGVFKNDIKPIIGKPLKHEPINQIPLIPKTKPSQNPSKPSSAVTSFKNDLAIIQSKSSKSKSDEKIQQLSKETAKKVQDARLKFNVLRNVIENINNNQENDLKFIKSDISTIRSNIDKLNEELIKSDEALKQRVERLNEYLNRECSIVELLGMKIQQNRKELVKETGLDETAQYFKDIISHKFNNIITNIEDLDNQVKRKLNLIPQKTPTLITLQKTLSLQRNRAVEYRRYVLSISQTLHSKEHVSATDLFIQNLSMNNSSYQHSHNGRALKNIQMTTIKPIVNNSSILKKKISLIQEDDTNIFQEYEDIDEISDIYYEDDESKNPLNQSFIQSENSSLDLLDEDDEEEEEEEEDEPVTNSINFNSSKQTIPSATSFPNTFIPPKQTNGAFNFGETKTIPTNSTNTPFNASLSTKTTTPNAQFNLVSATDPKKEGTSSLPKSVSTPTLNSGGFNFGANNTAKTDVTKPTIGNVQTPKEKDTIAFGTTPGFNFGKKEETTTVPKPTTVSTGFAFNPKEEPKPTVPITKSETTPLVTTNTGFNFGGDAKKELNPLPFTTKTEPTGSTGFNFNSTKQEEKKTEVSKTETLPGVKKESSLDSESTSSKVETKPVSNSFTTTPFSFGFKKDDPKVETKVEEPKKETSILPEKKEEIKPATTTPSGFSFANNTPSNSGFSFANTKLPEAKKETTPASTTGFSFGTTESTSGKIEQKNETIKEEAKKSEVSEKPKEEPKPVAFDFGKKEESNISDIFPTKKVSTTPISSEKSSFFESPPPVTDSKVLLTGFSNTTQPNDKMSFNFPTASSNTSTETKKIEEPKKEEIKELKQETKVEEPKKETPILPEPKKEEIKPAATTPSGFSFASNTPSNSGFSFANTKLPESKPVEVVTPKAEETKPIETKSNAFATNPFNTATTLPSVTKPAETSSFTSPNTTTPPSTAALTTVGFNSTPTITQPTSSTTKDENGMEDNDDVMIGSSGSGMGSLSLGTSSNNSSTPSGFTSFMNNNTGSSSNISSAFPSNNTITTFATGNSNSGSFFEPVNNSVGDSPFSNPSSNSSLPFSFQGNSSFGAKGSFSFDSGRNPGTTQSGFGTSSFGTTANNNPSSVLNSGFGSNTLNTDTTKTFGTSFGSSGFATKSNAPQPATSGGFGSGGFGSGGFGSGGFASSTNNNTQPSSGGFGSGGFAGTSGSSGFGSLASGSSPFSTLGNQGTPSFLQGNNPQPSFGANNNNNNGSFGSFGSFGGFGRTN